MRIGLLDIDCHAGKKKWGATVYPNIALGKLAAWHRAQGDDVEWAMPIRIGICSCDGIATYGTELFDNYIKNFKRKRRWRLKSKN